MTQDIPLPDPAGFDPHYELVNFTASQLTDYAAACVAQATQPLREEIGRLTLALDVVDRQLFELANRRLNDANAAARTIEELRATIERQQHELNAIDKALRCEGWPLEARIERATMLADLPATIERQRILLQQIFEATRFRSDGFVQDLAKELTALQDQLPKE